MEDTNKKQKVKKNVDLFYFLFFWYHILPCFNI